MPVGPIVPLALVDTSVTVASCCAFCLYAQFPNPLEQQGICQRVKGSAIHRLFTCDYHTLSPKKVRMAFHEELTLAILPKRTQRVPAYVPAMCPAGTLGEPDEPTAVCDKCGEMYEGTDAIRSYLREYVNDNGSGYYCLRCLDSAKKTKD